jgi:Mor family transcriptional regulator
MSYIRAEEVLPQDIIRIVQQYVDGENIYIPRKEEKKARWGDKSGAREELLSRNTSIYNDYLGGARISALSSRYYLSDKTIRRIIRDMKTSESA